MARDPSFVARFRKEALAAAGLNHPGIVAVYDSGEDPAPYIVMELVSGHTLRDIIHDGERLSVDRTLEIAEGILAALEYSHARGILHRDIKPANVMITDQGVVKVMDFGIARALDDMNATLTIHGTSLELPNIYLPSKRWVNQLIIEVIFILLVVFFMKSWLDVHHLLETLQFLSLFNMSLES